MKDDGTVDQDAPLGNEISASWLTVRIINGRSSTGAQRESGLAEKQYDAIVYIPSDFSQNILSYNHERPQKAELEFKIQDQLDAVNKEKSSASFRTRKNGEQENVFPVLALCQTGSQKGQKRV